MHTDLVGRADSARSTTFHRLGRVVASCALVVGAIATTPASAATTLDIPATGDLFAAGQPVGPCCGGDNVPTNNPTLVPLTFVPGEYLTFTATGGAAHVPNPAAVSPTGDGDTSSPYTLAASYGTGISGATGIYLNALGGVFLTDATPTGFGPAPFSAMLDAASFSPGLDQIFFIGDGLTGTGTGTIQQFVVPTGATRLYLGILDNGGYYDNFGSITASITAVSPVVVTPPPNGVPEPETLALLLGGIAAVGMAHRRRRTA